MKRTAILSIFVAASCVAFSQGENPALRQAAQKYYQQWDMLMAKQDVKGIWALFHPAYVMVDLEGKKHSLKDVKALYQGMSASSKDVKSKITLDHVGGTEQEILTWGTVTMSFKMKQGDKWVTQKFTEKFAETLVLTQKGYKLIFSQVLP